MAHATGFHGRVWEPIAHELQRHFHCWSIDLRAHGDSTAPTNRPLEWEGFADDIIAVVDAFGLDQPYGVGHSKGGAALLLAEQARPGMFRSLYLFEPVVMTPEWAQGYAPENPLAVGARRRRDTFESFDAAFDNFASKLPFSQLDRVALRLYVDHGFSQNIDGTVTLKCRPENEAEVYARGSAHQAFLSLESVRCPVTIALGAEDAIPAIFGRPIANALPNGSVDSHPGLGHFGPLEDPSRIAVSILNAFAPTSDS